MTAEELAAAYAATTYRVFLPGGMADLRIGQVNETLKAWMETAGSEHFAVITAYNPGSVSCAETVNAERQAQLEIDLLEGNYEPYAAQNIPDDEEAPTEESCFVADLAPEDALALAEDYGQLAVVCGTDEGVPELRWVGRE